MVSEQPPLQRRSSYAAAVSGEANQERHATSPVTNTGGTKAKCVYCGMTGHTIDKCYKKHGYPPGWVSGYKSKAKQQSTTSAVNNMTDLGVSTDQFQKLMQALQNQMGQSSNSNTAAAISLVPSFKEDANEVSDSGTAWDDDWFG